jgi:hypothetical protein
MTRLTRLILTAGFSMATPSGLAAMPVLGAQIQLDHIVSRVNGHAITESDVHQARALKLVEDVSSDAATQRAVEDRWLIIGEMNRAAPIAPPTDADVAARRSSWAAAIGGDIGALLSKHGMSENDLQTWFREDLRIRAYLKRQFGMLPEADRVRATDDWLMRLRQRAELR